MNKPKSLYIVGSIGLPRVDAGASRILELSQEFKNHFEKIIIAGRYDGEPHKYYDYDNQIVFLPYHRHESSGVLDKIKLAFFPDKFFIDDLIKCINEYDISHILIYSALAIRSVKKIKKIAKEHNIKVIYDVVEFQTSSKQTLVSFFSFYYPNICLNKRIIKKGDNVISISSYLHEHFISRGCNSSNVPFVFDTKNIKYVEQKNGDESLINLLYAGNPKKGKDLLTNCISGLALLPDEFKKKVRLNVAGVTLDTLLKKNKLSRSAYERTKDIVTYLGKVSNNDIEMMYSESDFSILVRDKDDRLSKAGFPTKVSESLVHAVPIICNLTSDLGDYLVNDYNSIIMNDESPEEFARCVLSALSKTKDELSTMRKNARETAEKKLDVFLFSDEIKNVLK